MQFVAKKTDNVSVASPGDPTSLDIHTLDSLCAELVSGRAVSADSHGGELRFDSTDTRSVFDWYRKNRDKWSKNVEKTDVEALVDQLEREPPNLPATIAASSSRPHHVLHLKSITAHRFAGIHRYGDSDNPPEDFEFEFDKPATLIEGMNGSGKTSLLSAIAWCLSGHIYRSQRPPETAERSVEIDVAEGSSEAGELSFKNTITAITPLPPGDVLRSAVGQPLPLDTWVELTFIDGSNEASGTAP